MINVHECYLASILQVKAKVYDLDLQPVSLGHCFILDAHKSPFFHEAEPLTIDSLMWHIAILTHSYEDCVKALNDGTLTGWLEEVGKQMGDPKWDIEHETRILADYIAVWMAAPPRWSDDKPKTSIKSPWMWRIAAVLMKELHLSKSEVWSMSVAEAQSWYWTCAEINGDPNLMDITEAQIEEQIARKRKAQERNGKVEAPVEAKVEGEGQGQQP